FPELKNMKNSKKLTSASKLKHQKKVSAFVTKLYSMLHDPTLSHLIWWSRLFQNDLTTFALLPGTEFASCLTTYFKHGNVASFVRQLHMYGFHKVCEGNQQHIMNNNNKNNKNNGGNSNINSDQNHTIWEFRHSSGKFRRSDQSHLHLIKRRVNSRRTSSNSDLLSINSVESTIDGNTLMINTIDRSQTTSSLKDTDVSDNHSIYGVNNNENNNSSTTNNNTIIDNVVPQK
ncbi:transcription factor Hsr1, partial [Pichia californica]